MGLGRGGCPWAIAPINEVKKSIGLCSNCNTKNKILMGIPLYGRNWKLPFVAGTTIAETVTYQEAIRRALRYGVAIQYNTLYQSPFYRYWDEAGAEHEVLV